MLIKSFISLNNQLVELHVVTQPHTSNYLMILEIYSLKLSRLNLEDTIKVDSPLTFLEVDVKLVKVPVSPVSQ